MYQMPAPFGRSCNIRNVLVPRPPSDSDNVGKMVNRFKR